MARKKISRSKLSPRASELMQCWESSSPRAKKAIRILNRFSHDIWNRQMLPLLESHYPECIGTPAYERLKRISCDVYVSAALVLHTVTHLPFSPLKHKWFWRALSILLRIPIVPRFAAWVLRRQVERYDSDFCSRLLIATALITATDDACDEPFGTVENRKIEAEKVLRGMRPIIKTPPLQMLETLLLAAQDLSDSKRIPLLNRIREKSIPDFFEAECQAQSGALDPEGIAFRAAGIHGSADAMLWAVGLAIDAKNPKHVQLRELTFRIGLLVQMTDDFLDIEKDRAGPRTSPVVQGVWTHETIRTYYEETTDLLRLVLQSWGAPSESTIQLFMEICHAFHQQSTINFDE